MKNPVTVLAVLMLMGLFVSVQAQGQIFFIYDFDSPDSGPITGLALGSGSLYAVSAGTNTLYRMDDETGAINDAWSVPVPDTYTITGLAYDAGDYVFIGLTSPDSCERILRYYSGTFESFDVPEIDYLNGLSNTWYTAGRGYIGTYNQLWSFEKTNPPVTDVTLEYDYPSPTDLPRDIACENPGSSEEGNVWVANFSTDFECLASLISPTGERYWNLNRAEASEVYGIACQVHSGGDYDYDLFVSTDTHKIIMYSYEYDVALEQATWGAIKSSF